MGEPVQSTNDAEVLANSPLRMIERTIKELLAGVVLDDLSSSQRIDLAAKLTSQYVRVFTLMQAVQQRLLDSEHDAVFQRMQQMILDRSVFAPQGPKLNVEDDDDDDDDDEPPYALTLHHKRPQ
jgi:hypothetical protein